jgi:hypothetical protein
MSKEIEEFCRKYDARVGPSSQPWRRSKPVPFPVFEEQGMGAFENIQYQNIPMVEITMPEDRFRALMEHDHWLEREFRRNDGIVGNGAVRLVREYERECRIRNEYPGVQAAWEQYQIMLRLVDPGQ